MARSRPLVSLCVPTYQRARFLGKTMESALAQTMKDFELIIVDDVSPDNTAEVVSRYHDPRIRYVRNEVNRGVPENLNVAFSFALGKYVVLLEDHDLLDPTYLEKTIDLLERHPSIGFATTALVTIDQDDNPIALWEADLPEVLSGRRLLRLLLRRTTCPFSVTVVIRRELLANECSPFDPHYWWYADQNLWMKLASKADFGYIAEPLLKMRTREPGHYLTEKVWESNLHVDRVHRDNWTLLHPRPSLGDLFDRSVYTGAKTWKLLRWRINREFLRDRPWTAEDDEQAKAYIPRPLCSLLNVVDLVPRRVGVAVGRKYAKFFWRRRSVPNPPTTASAA